MALALALALGLVLEGLVPAVVGGAEVVVGAELAVLGADALVLLPHAAAPAASVRPTSTRVNWRQGFRHGLTAISSRPPPNKCRPERQQHPLRGPGALSRQV